MGRLPKIRQVSESIMDVRIEIPVAIWKIAERVGLNLGVKSRPERVGLGIFFRDIAARLEKGDTNFLSTSVQEAVEDVRKDNHSAKLSTPDIDDTQLHRSTKLKSGFYGVFAGARNEGFRAEVRLKNGLLKSIGIFKSAAEAAWRRRKYYEANLLYYGTVELEIMQVRKDTPEMRGWSDHRVVHNIRTMDKIYGIVSPTFGPDCVYWCPPDDDDHGMSQSDYIANEIAKARAKLLDGAELSEPIALGFANGALPAAFGDDWKPPKD